MSKKIIENDTAEYLRFMTSFLLCATIKHTVMLGDDAKEKTALYREALIERGANPKEIDEYIT